MRSWSASGQGSPLYLALGASHHHGLGGASRRLDLGQVVGGAADTEHNPDTPGGLHVSPAASRRHRRGAFDSWRRMAATSRAPLASAPLSATFPSASPLHASPLLGASGLHSHLCQFQRRCSISQEDTKRSPIPVLQLSTAFSPFEGREHRHQ